MQLLGHCNNSEWLISIGKNKQPNKPSVSSHSLENSLKRTELVEILSSKPQSCPEFHVVSTISATGCPDQNFNVLHVFYMIKGLCMELFWFHSISYLFFFNV